MNKRRIPVAKPALNGNERRYVLDCMDTTWISTRGAYVERFENAFAAATGSRHAVSCANGSAALHLCLLALGIGPGDEVIVPTLTFVATANAVTYTGAKPVFVDVDANHWCLDLQAVKAKLTSRTKAIIPVHLYGHLADMDAIMTLAGEYKLAVVEDAAQAHGASCNGRKTGTLGHIAAFSFFANKTLTCGQGGMVTTADAQLAERVRHIANVGLTPDREYWHDMVGFNYRITNLEAAIGLAQTERFDYHLAQRHRVVSRYRKRLADIAGLHLQEIRQGVISGNWMVNVLLSGANTQIIRICRAHLDAQGIETRTGFPPVHRMPPYAGDGTTELPVAERISRESLTLPTYADLGDNDIDFICTQLQVFLRKNQLNTVW